MAAKIDHIILHVNDVKRSIHFYTKVLGFTHDGEDGPFSILRVNPDFMVLLSGYSTRGGDHLAFSMDRSEFDTVFERVRSEQIPFGDSYDTVGNMKGPGRERSARGLGSSVYFFDPSQHLVEIVHYE